MTEFANFEAAQRRLDILLILAAAHGWRAGGVLLQGSLERVFGHVLDADRLETELAWLADQGLVSVSHTGDFTVATLTERGLDVAQARARVPGVARPRPGSRL